MVGAWIVIFTPAILHKELSLMKKSGWKKYEKKSLILLPRLVDEYWVNYFIYVVVGWVGVLLYRNGGLSGLMSLNI